MADGWIAAAITGAGAIVAAVVAATGVFATNLVTKRLKERELLIAALQFNTGGTQRRSVGIALISKYADEDPRLRETAASIFIAQMHHLKDEGYRMGARIDNGRVQLLTRTGLDWTNKYPSVIEALATVKAKTAYIDGELCGSR